MDSTSAPPATWRKLLWVKQPYPDNHVDSSFLSQLKRNSQVQQYSYWTLAADSSVILLHLCTVAIFAIVFLGIYNHGWDPTWFAVGTTALTVGGYVMWDLQYKSHALGTTLRSSFLILFTLFALSPVLKSLTKSTSSDSIWSISCWLGALNVIFYDYSYDSKKEFKQMLSTNLALAAAIVLASRLSDTISVFCFVLFSVEMFGVLPLYALWIRKSSKTAHLSLLSALLLISDAGMCIIGGFPALLTWIGVQSMVTFVFPGWFLWLQKYKNQIEGPWDPARPVIRSN